ncbi:MAG TPA: hypothetical protein VKB37_21535, partial [Jatrophihabitantaceae bacterium]|nr:hypothetical protein [Jatrophihabitantaceae bacterium]
VFGPLLRGGEPTVHENHRPACPAIGIAQLSARPAGESQEPPSLPICVAGAFLLAVRHNNRVRRGSLSIDARPSSASLLFLSSLTKHGLVIGTPAYVTAERCVASRSVDQ